MTERRKQSGWRRAAAARRSLELALVLQCLGALGSAWSGGAPIALAATTLATAAAVAVAAGLDSRLAWVVAAWFAAAAAVETLTGGEPLARLALAAHATRFGIAAALALPRDPTTLLRVATALTFAAHGIEALALRPEFLDFIRQAGRLAGGWEVPSGGIAAALRLIGAVDLAVAVSIALPGKRRRTAGYMIFWGTVTALARTLHGGPAGLDDTLLRAANAAAPLSLLLRWRRP